MSSTNRGGTRSPADRYETQPWCVLRFLEKVTLPGGKWLEPCAGGGAIIEAVNGFPHGLDIEWSAIEPNPDDRERLITLVGNEDSVRTRCLWESWEWIRVIKPTVIFTNPPFRHTAAFLEFCDTLPPHTLVMLNRLNFLGSETRSKRLRSFMPDVYVLPNRPSFTGKGTDSIDYSWIVWPPERKRGSASVQVLSTTPASERRFNATTTS